jgi:hypothetical protein
MQEKNSARERCDNFIGIESMEEPSKGLKMGCERRKPPRA